MLEERIALQFREKTELVWALNCGKQIWFIFLVQTNKHIINIKVCITAIYSLYCYMFRHVGQGSSVGIATCYVLIVAFRDFANAPTNIRSVFTEDLFCF